MDNETRESIKEVINRVMESVIRSRCITEPFREEDVCLKNPFGTRLVPMEVWKGAKFERSFTSNLGKEIFEKIGRIIAEGAGCIAQNQRSTAVRICTHRIDYINELLQAQRVSLRLPAWADEIEQLLARDNNSFQEFRVVSDLYIQRPDGTEEFYSFKTVKPNLDQTENAKRSIMQLVADVPERTVFFALPYNPAGEGRPYRNAGHTYPRRLFNMDDDPCLLIGQRLWNRIGGSPNTYDELLDLFEEIGQNFVQRIRTDYFGLT